MVVLRIAPEADITQRVLNYGLEDVRRLHPYLLGEAALTGTCCRVHAEFFNNNFEQVKFFMTQLTQKLLIRRVGSIQMRILWWVHWLVLLFINLGKETIAAVLKFDNFVWF